MTAAHTPVSTPVPAIVATRPRWTVETAAGRFAAYPVHGAGLFVTVRP